MPGTLWYEQTYYRRYVLAINACFLTIVYASLVSSDQAFTEFRQFIVLFGFLLWAIAGLTIGFGLFVVWHVFRHQRLAKARDSSKPKE